jgi:hypothetical protein
MRQFLQQQHSIRLLYLRTKKKGVILVYVQKVGPLLDHIGVPVDFTATTLCAGCA